MLFVSFVVHLERIWYRTRWTWLRLERVMDEYYFMGDFLRIEILTFLLFCSSFFSFFNVLLRNTLCFKL